MLFAVLALVAALRDDVAIYSVVSVASSSTVHHSDTVWVLRGVLVQGSLCSLQYGTAAVIDPRSCGA